MILSDIFDIKRGINNNRDLSEDEKDNLINLKNDYKLETHNKLYFFNNKNIIFLPNVNKVINKNNALKNNDIIMNIANHDIYLYQGDDDYYFFNQNFYIIRLKEEYKNEEIIFTIFTMLEKIVNKATINNASISRLDISIVKNYKIPELNELTKYNKIIKNIFELQVLLKEKNKLEEELLTNKINGLMKGV